MRFTACLHLCSQNLILSDPEIDSITWQKETVAESVTVTRQAHCINHSIPSSPSPWRSSSVYPGQSAAHTPTKVGAQAPPFEAQPASFSSQKQPAQHQHWPLQQEPSLQPSPNNKVIAPLHAFAAPSAPTPADLKPPAVDEKPDSYYVVTVGQEVWIFFIGELILIPWQMYSWILGLMYLSKLSTSQALSTSITARSRMHCWHILVSMTRALFVLHCLLGASFGPFLPHVVWRPLPPHHLMNSGLVWMMFQKSLHTFHTRSYVKYVEVWAMDPCLSTACFTASRFLTSWVVQVDDPSFPPYLLWHHNILIQWNSTTTLHSNVFTTFWGMFKLLGRVEIHWNKPKKGPRSYMNAQVKCYIDRNHVHYMFAMSLPHSACYSTPNTK